MAAAQPTHEVTVDGLKRLAQLLAVLVRSGDTIALRGDLGAGKTTFARALLRALGVGERVKSPTYSLIESYRADRMDIHHLDLYRIADAGELEWLGLPELSGDGSLFIVEWPERGAGALPEADLRLSLAHADTVRDLRVETPTRAGEAMLSAWLAAATPD